MIDRFEDMRTFVAVVENRSFGGAAAQLGVVKSAVALIGFRGGEASTGKRG